jgi:methyl-accepting chemotaxis protein
LYRFTKTLDQIGGGDLTVDTKLRAGDELKPFAARLDSSVADLRAKVNALKESYTRLEGQLGENATSELRRVAGEVRAQLDAFKS